MPSISKLTVELQGGSTSTYLAKWEFDETIKSTTSTSSAVTAGSLVSIKSGATYYNGVSIPSWVMSQKWYLIEVRGDRAVLGKNESGTNDICSPINTKFLSGGGSSSTVVTSTFSHYNISWYYDTGDAIWFSGGEMSKTTVKYITYSAPTNIVGVRIEVTPVAKTYKVNGADTAYWTGTTVAKSKYVSENPPEKPSAPTVNVEKYQLTASLENIQDARSDEIQFEIYDGTKVINTGTVTVVTRRASFSCQISAGGDYRARCRAANLISNTKVYSDWSDFSGSVNTIPSVPSAITSCRATSQTSVHLEWSPVTSATSYDIEYTTKKEYFEGSDKTSKITGIESTVYEKTGLETGQEYFFRVRAVNSKGASAWSGIKSIIIGKDPIAPTTWSSTTTVITGEPLTLYWVHNAQDGSSQTYAELELVIDGIKETRTIKNTEDEDTKDKTSSYAIDTSRYIEGTVIKWRVRTAGITKTYGDWSVQRVVDIYAPVTLDLSITDVDGERIETLTSFPFYIRGLAGPKTQVPIGYHLTITSNDIYKTIDNVGNEKIVTRGEEVYSKYFDISEALIVELSAHNIDLENNISYTVTCLVSMNSGLTAVSSLDFMVQWADQYYEPDIEIGIDTKSYTAYLKPYCFDADGSTIDNVFLSVYRREFDGSFTEIATEIDSASNTYISDPHPSLDYARYRVIATSKDTGAISYYDAPGYPVGGKAAIIQWDEEWTNFNTTNTELMEEPPLSGSMLKLFYNIDITDKNDSDVTFAKYIGRKRPVSYYGTQLGETSVWRMEIDKKDTETLYALRRLAIWMGDVYVREPSGSGYPANVSVSFNQTHRELTIPVTMDVTRVEGGM